MLARIKAGHSYTYSDAGKVIFVSEPSLDHDVEFLPSTISAREHIPVMSKKKRLMMVGHSQELSSYEQ